LEKIADRVRIRSCGPGEAATLRDVMIRCWTGTIAPDSSAFRETPEAIAAQLARGAGALMLDGEEAIGCGRYCAVPGPVFGEREWVEFKRIGVLSAFRGQGLGRLIPEFLEGLAREGGFGGVQLGVRHDQLRLVECWRRLGFEPADDVQLDTVNPLTPTPVFMRKPFAG